MAFTHFPWFRYANDDDVKCIEVWHNDPVDDHGEFWVYWPMLGVHLGTGDIKWHSENPIKLPHPIGYPNARGKLINRNKNNVPNEQYYEVETEVKFNCTFTVAAESAEQAKWLIAQKCCVCAGDVKIDVQIPFNEISWKFDSVRCDAIVKGKTKRVRKEETK